MYTGDEGRYGPQRVICAALWAPAVECAPLDADLRVLCTYGGMWSACGLRVCGTQSPVQRSNLGAGMIHIDGRDEHDELSVARRRSQTPSLLECATVGVRIGVAEGLSETF